MAEKKTETAQDIKARVSALKDELKTHGMLSKAKIEQLKTLRAQLKEINNLNKNQKKLLQDSLKQNDIEKMMLHNAKQKGKQEQGLSKLQSDQIKLNLKAVQGQLTSADIAEHMNKLKGIELQAGKLIKKGDVDRGKALQEQTKFMRTQIEQGKDISDYQEQAGDAEDKMRAMTGDIGKKFEGLKSQAKGFGAMLATPAGAMLAIGAAIAMAAKFMFDMVKAGMELQKELGLSAGETLKLQATLMAASWEMKGLGIDSAEVKETAMALVNEFGSFENVTKETLVSMSKMNTEFGIAGSTSAALLGVMESVSGESREALMSQMESTAELARAAGVAPGQVMADVASDTEFFSKYAKDGGANVMEAAIQAKKLGLNMSTVSAMADSLLDFESSISNQMEASMMLGRSINTDAARRLALEGDLVGMQKEVMKQVGNEAEFNAMNTLQRQALAKAFGLSVSDLGKMVRDQEVLNNMTAEETAARDAQAKALEATKKKFLDIVAQVKELGMQIFMMILPAFKLIAGAISIIFTILSPFIEGIKVIWPILSPIVKILGVIILAMYAWAAAQWILNVAMAANPIGLIILGIVGLVGLVAILMKKFKNFGEVVKVALAIAFWPLTLAFIAFKAMGSLIGKLFGGGGGDKSKEVGASAGGEAKDFISRPGTGMEKFSPKDTIVGVQDPGALGGGGGTDMTVTNEKLQEMINEIIALRTSMDSGQKKLTKKVGDMGVAG